MKPYLYKALRQFDTPYPHVPPKFGAKEQYTKYDTSPPIGVEEQKHIQKVNGKFLLYGRAANETLLTPLSALTSQQSKPLMHTIQRVKQFLDYCTTHEPAVLTYNKSNMVLKAHSNASYLNESNARS